MPDVGCILHSFLGFTRTRSVCMSWKNTYSIHRLAMWWKFQRSLSLMTVFACGSTECKVGITIGEQSAEGSIGWGEHSRPNCGSNATLGVR